MGPVGIPMEMRMLFREWEEIGMSIVPENSRACWRLMMCSIIGLNVACLYRWINLVINHKHPLFKLFNGPEDKRIWVFIELCTLFFPNRVGNRNII